MVTMLSSDKILSNMCNMWHFGKGHLISKCLSIVNNSPKNELEKSNFCPSLLGQTFFPCFLGELEILKSPFEINWPLAGAFMSVVILMTGLGQGNMFRYKICSELGNLKFVTKRNLAKGVYVHYVAHGWPVVCCGVISPAGFGLRQCVKISCTISMLIWTDGSTW
jgi:hypothetical protein